MRPYPVTPHNIKFYQLDVNNPSDSLPFIALRAKSFSLLRKGLNIEVLEDLACDMPLWHNVLFLNKHHHAYSCPPLMRAQVTTAGQLLEDDSNLALLAHTWCSIYRDAIERLTNCNYVFSEGSQQQPCALSARLEQGFCTRCTAIPCGTRAGGSPQKSGHVHPIDIAACAALPWRGPPADPIFCGLACRPPPSEVAPLAVLPGRRHVRASSEET